MSLSRFALPWSFLLIQQVVGDVQGRHHGDAVGANNFAAAANFAHLAVQAFEHQFVQVVGFLP